MDVLQFELEVRKKWMMPWARSVFSLTCDDVVSEYLNPNLKSSPLQGPRVSYR